MRLTFIRHAHSDYHRNDLERVLNSKGIEQTLALSKLTRDIEFDTVIHSPAVRAKETCDILLYSCTLKPKVFVLNSLYLPDDDDDAIAEVSKAVMLHPLATPNEILKRSKADIWQRYSLKASNDLKTLLNKKQNALVIGHRTILNLIAHHLTQDEQLKERYLGSLEGFSINIKDHVCELARL